MPFKANRERRHHIPKQRHRVTNWAEYDAGLRARGSLTVWFTAEAIEGWRAEPRTGRGGQPRHFGAWIRAADARFPTLIRVHTVRTYSGRPSSSMRFNTWVAIAISVS